MAVLQHCSARRIQVGGVDGLKGSSQQGHSASWWMVGEGGKWQRKDLDQGHSSLHSDEWTNAATSQKSKRLCAHEVAERSWQFLLPLWAA